MSTAHLTLSRPNGSIAVEIHQTSDMRGRSSGKDDILGREAMSRTPGLGLRYSDRSAQAMTGKRIESNGLLPRDLRVVDIGGRLIEGAIAVSFKANARLPNANTAVIELLVRDISVEAIATIAPEGEAKK
jgi:hypothetical protein